MPKSDHLHFDFFCAARMEPTRSGPSASLLVRATTSTGRMGRGAPAFSASSSPAGWGGGGRGADGKRRAGFSGFFVAGRLERSSAVVGGGVRTRREYRRILVDESEGAAED